jgi:glucokinase
VTATTAKTSGNVLAVDIGGTNIRGAIVTPEGAMGEPYILPTPRLAEAEVVFSTVLSVIKHVRSGSEVACGISCAGIIDGSMRVTATNIPSWNAFPLGAEVSKATGLRTIMENDGRALAYAEGWMGAAVGSSSYMSVTVSTGVGSGLVVDGHLLRGGMGSAGEVGHIVVDPDGDDCACGGRGCLETVASGPAIERRTGVPPSTATIATMKGIGATVGAALAPLVVGLDLDLVTVGGSVALGFGSWFFTTANAELERRLPPFAARAGERVVPTGLGKHGCLLGAASFALGLGA